MRQRDRWGVSLDLQNPPQLRVSGQSHTDILAAWWAFFLLEMRTVGVLWQTQRTFDCKRVCWLLCTATNNTLWYLPSVIQHENGLLWPFLAFVSANPYVDIIFYGSSAVILCHKNCKRLFSSFGSIWASHKIYFPSRTWLNRPHVKKKKQKKPAVVFAIISYSDGYLVYLIYKHIITEISSYLPGMAIYLIPVYLNTFCTSFRCPLTVTKKCDLHTS